MAAVDWSKRKFCRQKQQFKYVAWEFECSSTRSAAVGHVLSESDVPGRMRGSEALRRNVLRGTCRSCCEFRLVLRRQGVYHALLCCSDVSEASRKDRFEGTSRRRGPRRRLSPPESTTPAFEPAFAPLGRKMTDTVLASNLGFPRIGAARELKKALEAFWKGKSSAEELSALGAELRLRHWRLQKEAGLDVVPSNDFSYYDHVLDMACTLGCIPSRFKWSGDAVSFDLLFALARGREGTPALEMTKWFDTNYHFMVPEFEQGQVFALSSSKIFDEVQEAAAAGIRTRPVLLGPVSFTLLGKCLDESVRRSAVLEAILPVYVEILERLRSLGVESVQMDEPHLALDLDQETRAQYAMAYERLSAAAGPKLMLATYFEGLEDNLDVAFSLPVDVIHLDLVRAPEQLDQALERAGDKTLSLGVVNGRNIWRNDLSASLVLVEKAVRQLGKGRVMVGPSCSLLHSPVDLDFETAMDDEIKSWMAFATQKVAELRILADAANRGRQAVEGAFAGSDAAKASRRASPRVVNEAVEARVAKISPEMYQRKTAFSDRCAIQREHLSLPMYPTTTIGSFPQTPEIRQTRAAYRSGKMEEDAYKQFMRAEIQRVVEIQHSLGLDVLVHGEPERNDMVEYFGEQLHGMVVSKNGWVQSYGSRCVKPPIIFGDVFRKQQMTVEWLSYAQSLTDRPMKGMLTGPVTMLKWSFVRDDQPREVTALQIALAIRDEVSDLEAAGIRIIQIDEAAYREGLPLRRAKWASYLRHAEEAFRLASSIVEDSTQIHTHMCYSEFNDIIESIAALDADVISIETSRSHMELLDAFIESQYPNNIGPGVYDVHSPRVPPIDEMLALLKKARSRLTDSQIWINPDCGLKTRNWAEVMPALENLVAVSKIIRTM
eukprot:scaffold2608_cov245-Pinguiococcus_pyrenoidosus.AAC.7